MGSLSTCASPQSSREVTYRLINIPRGLIEFRIWSHVGYPDKLDKNQKIVIYCGTGARAALAAKSLRDLHFNNVTAVDMTIEDWRKSGYPLELG